MGKTKPFASARQLNALIDAYFQSFSGETSKTTKIKAVAYSPPTFTGLILFLGFDSWKEFGQYQTISKYAATLDRALLRVVKIYEERLQTHSSGGAIFALKKMPGWNDAEKKLDGDETDNVLQVEILQSDLKPVSSEKEVVL